MITQKVRPDNGSREGKWVALSIVGILATASFLMPLHQVDSPHSDVLSHQVRITDLHQEELGLIAELKLAHEELRDLHAESGTWPDTEEMASLWIAPFVQDQNWKRKGSHQWQSIGDGIYLGIRQSEQGAASMILDSRQSHADIWLIDAHGFAPTPTLSEESHRHQQGWQQLILSSPSFAHPSHT
ncbi:hypothetical protein RGL54_000020 [Vibrio parahaemolyticus]|nr:hypothetical protein [Vibrio parahaemolyticus]